MTPPEEFDRKFMMVMGLLLLASLTVTILAIVLVLASVLR